jgi:hypothetical protein
MLTRDERIAAEVASMFAEYAADDDWRVAARMGEMHAEAAEDHRERNRKWHATKKARNPAWWATECERKRIADVKSGRTKAPLTATVQCRACGVDFVRPWKSCVYCGKACAKEGMRRSRQRYQARSMTVNREREAVSDE